MNETNLSKTISDSKAPSRLFRNRLIVLAAILYFLSMLLPVERLNFGFMGWKAFSMSYASVAGLFMQERTLDPTTDYRLGIINLLSTLPEVIKGIFLGPDYAGGARGTHILQLLFSLSALANSLMIVSPFYLASRARLRQQKLFPIFFSIFASSVLLWFIVFFGQPIWMWIAVAKEVDWFALGPGYYCWATSFVVMAVALFMRD